jgi:hypothetical protein
VSITSDEIHHPHHPPDPPDPSGLLSAQLSKASSECPNVVVFKNILSNTVEIVFDLRGKPFCSISKLGIIMTADT